MNIKLKLILSLLVIGLFLIIGWFIWSSSIQEKNLTEIARDYIKQKPEIYSLDNDELVSWDDSERIGTKLYPEWFLEHKPERVRYSESKGRYVIYWRYMPNCEKKGDSWYDREGFLCMGGYAVSVIINNDLQPRQIEIGILRLK